MNSTNPVPAHVFHEQEGTPAPAAQCGKPSVYLILEVSFLWRLQRTWTAVTSVSQNMVTATPACRKASDNPLSGKNVTAYKPYAQLRKNHGSVSGETSAMKSCRNRGIEVLWKIVRNGTRNDVINPAVTCNCSTAHPLIDWKFKWTGFNWQIDEVRQDIFLITRTPAGKMIN